MNLSALLPLLFWLVVGFIAGVRTGMVLQKRKSRRAAERFIPSLAEKRANIAAAGAPWPKGVAHVARPESGQKLDPYAAPAVPMAKPPTPPHIRRNRIDPDATAELRILPDASTCPPEGRVAE